MAKVIIWLITWIGPLLLSVVSTQWVFQRGVADGILGRLTPLLGQMSSFIPLMPDLTEVERCAYTLEQAGWSIRGIAMALFGFWTFYVSLISLRLTWRVMNYIRG